ATVGVDARRVRAGLLDPRQDDGGEGLVDLHHVDVVDRQAGLLQRVLGGRDGRRQHHHRVVTPDGEVVDAGAGLQAVLLDRLGGGEQPGGGAVTDLRGDGGGE